MGKSRRAMRGLVPGGSWTGRLKQKDEQQWTKALRNNDRRAID